MEKMVLVATHMYSCYILRPSSLTFIFLLYRICVVEVISTCCVTCRDDGGSMLIWYVRRYLQDCTTSRPRRLLCIFIVFAVTTTDLTCTRTFYVFSSVKQKKGCLWNLVIRRETRTSGDLFFIRPALFQLNSMLWYITKAPIPQENMSLSLNLKWKKSLWRESTFL